MGMKAVLGIALLVAGGLLLYYGMEAKDSVSSEVQEAVEGTPSDKALWLLVLGALSAVGGVGLLVGSRGGRT